MSFYEVFQEECKKPLLANWEISKSNLDAVKKYGVFLDMVGEENYQRVANGLCGHIEYITSGAILTAGVKTRIKRREEDLKVIDKFLDMLESDDRYFRHLDNEEKVEKIKTNVKIVRNIFEDENETSYGTDALINKTRLEKYLETIVEQYNIPNSTAKIRKLKDNIKR